MSTQIFTVHRPGNTLSILQELTSISLNFDFWVYSSLWLILVLSAILVKFQISHSLLLRILLVLLYSSCLMPLVNLAAKHRSDLFSPITLFNLFILFQQGFWSQLILSGVKLSLPASLGVVLPGLPEALSLSILGVLVFDLGYNYRVRRPARVDASVIDGWRYSRLRQSIWVLCFIAAITMIFLFRGMNINQYLSNINSNRIVGLIGKWSYISLAESALTLATVLALILYVNLRQRIWLFIAGLIALCGIALGLMIGYRVVSATIFLVALFFYHLNYFLPPWHISI